MARPEVVHEQQRATASGDDAPIPDGSRPITPTRIPQRDNQSQRASGCTQHPRSSASHTAIAFVANRSPVGADPRHPLVGEGLVNAGDHPGITFVATG